MVIDKFYLSLKLVKKLSPQLSIHTMQDRYYLVDRQTGEKIAESINGKPEDLMAWTIKKIHDRTFTTSKRIDRLTKELEKAKEDMQRYESYIANLGDK